MSIKSIPHSISTTDDLNSMDDVIDLNQAFNHEHTGRLTSMSATNKSSHYRISLHSIDDDELKRFHRDLVTPAPSVCFDDDHIPRTMFRQRHHNTPTASSSYPNRPVSRCESVMLFKKINNGDEDVSFDLVSSEFRDFLDTDFMMDDVLSHPVSRTTISKNASKIQDTFRNTVYKTGDYNKTITRSSLLSRKRYPQQTNTNFIASPSLNPRLAAATTTASSCCSSSPSNNKGENNIMLPINNNNNNTNKFRSTTNKVIPYEDKKKTSNHTIDKKTPITKDEYLYKHIPKRLITTTVAPSLSQREQLNAIKKQQSANNLIRTTPRNNQRLYNPGEENRYRNTHNRSYSNNYVEEEAEPELYEFKSRRTRQPAIRTFERNRSDTTSSSSSDDLPEEYHSPPQNPIRPTGKTTTNPVLLAQDIQDIIMRPTAASILQHHRYSVPNTRIHNQQDVKKSLSSSRLLINKSKQPQQEESNSDISVTDSAKQVLACIRERRKSAMKMEQSPKLEGRTRFISPSLSTQQQQEDTFIASDFRTRLQLHSSRDYLTTSSSRNKTSHHVEHRGLYTRQHHNEPQQQQFYENDGRLLMSRLPQRTLYR